MDDTTAAWPVLRTYTGDDRTRISVPLGGIGTGTVGLGGRGQLRDWELQNVPDKGSVVPETFFAIRARRPGSAAPEARIVEGALFPGDYEGGLGSPAPLAGFPRFEDCVVESAYPLTRIVLSSRGGHDGFPARVELEAFNPLVPPDADDSGWPVAVWRIRVVNVTDEPLEVALLCSVGNFIGASQRSWGGPGARPRAERRHAPGARGVLLGEDGLAADDEAWGTFAAAALGDEGRTWDGPDWQLGRWNQGLRSMWDGFVTTGRPGAPTSGERFDPMATPAATLGVDLEIPARGTGTGDFLFAWHFPNRRAWTFSGPGPQGGSGDEIVGNHYTTLDADAWEALARFAPRRDELEAATVAFVSSVATSDLALPVKEAALCNLSTLRSPTVFRTADGNPFGWEGVLDHAGSCPGSCTHVWNYDLATPLLFGDLARRMRALELEHATAANGAMSFRIMLPLSRAQEWGAAAADGQFGCVVKLYREWRLSGDAQLVARLWPACRRAMEFAWLEGGWDADADGVAEGALHNTMDVEYFGPNPLIQGWYLAALAAAARLADHVGDRDFAARCERLRAEGAAWTEEHLFNGEYYIQQIRPPGDFASVRPELRLPALGSAQAERPEYQIGTGCLVDQLAGDVAARFAGLGGVFDPDHAATTVDSIHRLNFVADFGRWTNAMRSYVLDGDAGHRMVAYPDGVPEHPMPYWSEVMTGFEYTYALALVHAGRPDAAEAVVTSIRDRYDGRRRNPFDEAECGHHYARAMASWGLIGALTGFSYSAPDARFEVAASPGPTRWPWSSGDAWGTVVQTPRAAGRDVVLGVGQGRIDIAELVVGGVPARLASTGTFRGGDTVEATVTTAG